jgi:hypothetical protein
MYNQLDGLVQKVSGLLLNTLLDVSRVLNSKHPKQRALQGLKKLRVVLPLSVGVTRLKEISVWKL